MKFYVLIAATLALVAGLPPGIVSAHGGGLNSEGCHNNRKTGDYHCHRSPAAAAPAPTAKTRSSEAPNSDPAAAPAPTAKTPSSGAFRNCSEARAAGAAPVRRGDPGYGTHLDRDKDGIGCE